MTLTKNKMVREIGRRTRLKNHDVQAMLEAMVGVWTDELVGGGRIELENFLVLEIKEIDRGINGGTLQSGSERVSAPQVIKRLIVRPSKHLKQQIKD